ncbi:MAG: hypothetical protein AWU55_1360 [Halomonadaceae bacterium T82-2]|nr:MAG: hypothetical protein AWU55_1360 [Halomonadaceae bacterium T82-2]
MSSRRAGRTRRAVSRIRKPSRGHASRVAFGSYRLPEIGRLVQRWLCLWLLWLPMGAAGADEVVVIANPDVEVTTLSHDMARAIFAMRQRTWPDGRGVSVFVLPGNHPVHKRFAKSRLNVYPHQLQLAWDRAVFSGTGQAPYQADDQQAMLQQVASTPGAIGYLERDHLEDSVHVISLAN